MKRTAAGFTLVELLATLVITSLILVAVAPVTASLARSHAVGQKAYEAQGSAGALRRLFASDLGHGEQYRIVGARVEVAAHVALDPKTLAIEHLSSTLGYEVRRVGSVGWLVRTQDSVLAGRLTEPVCSGVRAVRLRSARAEPEPPPSADGWRPLPEAVVVSVDSAAAGAAPMEFTVWTR